MKVEERNQWESRTYFWGIQCTQLIPGNCATIQAEFPNGARLDLDVLWVSETHTYSDHGHDGYARSWVPYAIIDLHGSTVHRKLSQLSDVLWIRSGDGVGLE